MKDKYMDLTWCILCTGKAQEVWINTLCVLYLWRILAMCKGLATV